MNRYRYALLFFLILLEWNFNASARELALWVTRWDFKNAADIAQIMENAKSFGFCDILFQVRGNATVQYPSKIEPWGWELTGDSPSALGQDPGWDPLAVAIQEAHKRGLKIQAWMNVFPGWRGLESPPRTVQHPWTNHRAWFMIDQFGSLMLPSKNFYTFLSPGIPQVRSYLASVFGETAKNYPKLDGIHMDYVRYPARNEVGKLRDFSYDKTSVSIFKKKYKTSPAYDLPEWQQFKCDQVTESIRAIHNAVRRASPTMQLSATCVAEIEKATSETGQDPRVWLEENLVQWVIPMAYRHTAEQLSTTLQQLDLVMDERWKERLIVGLNIDFIPAGEISRQIRLVSETHYGGMALFAYKSLFPDHAPDQKANVVQAELREQRLKEILRQNVGISASSMEGMLIPKPDRESALLTDGNHLSYR